MALTPQQIAVELNRLQSQGLTLEQAEKQVPGASALINSQGLTVSDNGTVEVFTTGATKTTGQNYTAADNAESAREESTYRTGASTSTTFTNEQVSTSGGGVTTTTVTPTTYKDTPASQTLQAQANAAGLEKEAYAQSLRDQGKSGAQILRDPTYRELSAKQTSLSNQAADAKTPVGGEVTTTYQAGPSETINSTTVTSSVTNSQVPETAQTRVTTEPEATRQQVAAIDSGDSAVNTTKIAGAQGNNTLVQTNTVQGAATASSDVSTNTAQPQSVQAPVNPSSDAVLSRQQEFNDTGGVPSQTLERDFAVTDTGGVPADTLSNIDGDTGFVPQVVGPPPPPGADPQVDPRTPAQIAADDAAIRASGSIRADPVPNYVTSYDPETGQYDVYNQDTGQKVQQGLTEQQATLAAQDLSAGAGVGVSENVKTFPPEPAINPYTAIEGRELTDEEIQNADNPDDAEQEIVVGPDGSLTTITRSRAEAQAEAETLRQAQALQQLRAKNTNEDWRLRISLAPGANYLYRAPDAGILQPLLSTSGVVFPYTPSISTNYRASYDVYDLVHTNYKNYFYKNSSVEEISISGVFTANSAAEADYLLAVIHFFRSASKMFYGQDSNPVAGTPPPVLFMDGLGVYQFNEHPCLLNNFAYSLPSDVDYIRAGGARNYSGGAVNLAGIRNQQGAASNSPLSATLSRLTSLKNTFDNFINPGARANNPVSQNTTNYYGIAGQPTYVPTKITIAITLYPLISRQEQAQSFSLKNYATGQGLRERGFF
jgi:hypothetical protein